MGRRPFVAERIVEAAFDCFARRGFEAVTSREVAAAAGVGHASMYRHFPSMEDLGHRVWEQGLAALEAEFAELESQAPKPRAALSAAVGLLYRAYDTRPRALALLVFPPHDITPWPCDPGNAMSIRNRCQRLWACDEDRGALLWGAITGPLIDRYLRRRSGTMEPLAKHHVQLLKHLVAARGATP